MPTVSTGGTPLQPAIGPTTAAATRHTTAVDGRFAALLAPIAAEVAKSTSQPAQPMQGRPAEPQHQAPDRTTAVIQPAESAVADPPPVAENDTMAQSAQIAAAPDEPGAPQEPIELALGGSIPPQPASDPPRTPESARPDSKATAVSETAPVTNAAAGAPVANAMREQNEASPVQTEAGNQPTALPSKVFGQSDALPAIKASNTAKSDPGTATSAGAVAVTEPVHKSSALPAGKPPDPAATAVTTISVASEILVEAQAGKRSAAMPREAAATPAHSGATATTSEATASKNKLPISDAGSSASIVSAAGTHMFPKPQSDDADPPAGHPDGTALPGANVVATGQPVPANSSAITVPAAVVRTQARTQSDAGNPSAVTSVGMVATATTDTTPASDQTSPQPPGAASTIPAANGVMAPSTPPTQQHDTRTDPGPSPLFTTGVLAPTASDNTAAVPPTALPPPLPSSTATQQVAMHVAQSLNDGGKTVTIELHPAELGRVEIHFTFHSDGTNVRLTVDRPETFDAFSHDRSGLQQQLAQAGVSLGGGGLDLRLGQQQSDQPGSYSSGRTPRVAMPVVQPNGAPATLWVSNSLLDILA